jgi:hypothetical protein
VLKAWCEIRTGRNLGPSDVAEERRRPCRARWGHDLSMGRLLEKLGLALYSPECVEGKPCAVQYRVENNMGGWKCSITLPRDRRISCGS